jgi:uncharacterized membrane protein
MGEAGIVPKKRFLWCVGIAVLGYFLLILALSTVKILSFKGTFDLSVFNQIFWMLKTTGIPMITTQPPFVVLNGFGWHFSPIFYLLLPVYAVFPSPFTLQVIQCLCFALSALPIALMLRHMQFSSGMIATALVMLLFNPLYFNATLWDFHEISLACLWISTACWALVAKRKYWFLSSLILLLLTKEHYGLCVAGFGMLWAIHHRDWKFGLSVCAFGVLALILVLKVIMPWLNEGLPHPMLRPEMGDKTTSRYYWLFSATSIKEVWDGINLRLFSIITPEGVSGAYYLFCLFLTLCFIPLLAPLYLLPAASDLAMAVLSLNPLPRLFFAYHSAPLIPILILAYAHAVRRNRFEWKLEHKPFALFVVFVVVNTALCLQDAKFRALHIYEIGFNQPKIDFTDANIIRDITGEHSVSVQSNISFLFSERPEVYAFPMKSQTVDFVIVHVYHPFEWFPKSPFIYSVSSKEHYIAIYDLLNDSPHYGIRYWHNNWLVLEKNASDIAPVREDVLERVEAILKTGLKKP